jgi:adenosine deaminase
VTTVEQAVAQTSAASGITARVILSTLRHFSQAQGLETVHLAKQFRGTHVVALDIAGDEDGYPLDAHLAAFQYAIDRGIPRTAQAGEARSVANAWEALRHLQPTRRGMLYMLVRTLGDAMWLPNMMLPDYASCQSRHQ